MYINVFAHQMHVGVEGYTLDAAQTYARSRRGKQGLGAVQARREGSVTA